MHWKNNMKWFGFILIIALIMVAIFYDRSQSNSNATISPTSTIISTPIITSLPSTPSTPTPIPTISVIISVAPNLTVSASPTAGLNIFTASSNFVMIAQEAGQFYPLIRTCYCQASNHSNCDENLTSYNLPRYIDQWTNNPNYYDCPNE